jgi:hypothetical protein
MVKRWVVLEDAARCLCPSLASGAGYGPRRSWIRKVLIPHYYNILLRSDPILSPELFLLSLTLLGHVVKSVKHIHQVPVHLFDISYIDPVARRTFGIAISSVSLIPSTTISLVLGRLPGAVRSLEVIPPLVTTNILGDGMTGP